MTDDEPQEGDIFEDDAEMDGLFEGDEDDEQEIADLPPLEADEPQDEPDDEPTGYGLGNPLAGVGAKLKRNWRPIIGSTVAIAVVGLLEYVFLLVWGPLGAVAITLAFVLGFVTIPLWAYALMDSVPWLSPMLGKLCFTLGSAGLGSWIWYQKESDEYEIRYADPNEWGPKNYWTRFAFANVGFAYERSEEAFNGKTVDSKKLEEIKAVEDDLSSAGVSSELDGPRAPLDIDRGGVTGFVRTDMDLEDRLLIPMGRVLSEVLDSAGLKKAQRGHDVGIIEHGGDSDEHSTKSMGIITAIFAILGILTGYVLLFGVV